jgi:hypothetical protein
MTREEKIEYMLNDLAQRGVRKSTAAPWFYQMLWRLGFDIAPPLFGVFWSNALVMGGFFFAAYGCITWLLSDQSFVSHIIESAQVGTLFGLMIATYFRWRWRKLGLPHWEDYPTGGHSVK